jgi:hypothetical protein
MVSDDNRIDWREDRRASILPKSSHHTIRSFSNAQAGVGIVLNSVVYFKITLSFATKAGSSLNRALRPRKLLDGPPQVAYVTFTYSAGR